MGLLGINKFPKVSQAENGGTRVQTPMPVSEPSAVTVHCLASVSLKGANHHFMFLCVQNLLGVVLAVLLFFPGLENPSV